MLSCFGWDSRVSRLAWDAATCKGWWSAVKPLWRTSCAPCCCHDQISDKTHVEQRLKQITCSHHYSDCANTVHCKYKIQARLHSTVLRHVQIEIHFRKYSAFIPHVTSYFTSREKNMYVLLQISHQAPQLLYQLWYFVPHTPRVLFY